MPLTSDRTTKANHTFDRKVGGKVRELREWRGLSQQQLADKTKLDFTKISRVENGERRLSLREGCVIARALGVTMTQFTEKLI